LLPSHPRLMLDVLQGNMNVQLGAAAQTVTTVVLLVIVVLLVYTATLIFRVSFNPNSPQFVVIH